MPYENWADVSSSLNRAPKRGQDTVDKVLERLGAGDPFEADRKARLEQRGYQDDGKGNLNRRD